MAQHTKKVAALAVGASIAVGAGVALWLFYKLVIGLARLVFALYYILSMTPEI